MAKKKENNEDELEQSNEATNANVDDTANEKGTKKNKSSKQNAGDNAAGSAQEKVTVNAEMKDVYLELAARFILNAPPEELENGNRLLFLVEQAHWYYEDFTIENRPSKKPLKSMQLRSFALEMFTSVPSLKKWVGNYGETFSAFLKYKYSIPTCGAVLLNPAMDKCLMVRGWGKNNKSLGFPKGKMDAKETEAECAAREVEEEIGVDIRQFIVEEDKVTFYRKVAGGKYIQKNTLFIIQGISEETKFLTHTRKEISDIVWNPMWIFALPEEKMYKYKNKYSSCWPGLKSLSKWVQSKQKKHPKPRMNAVNAPQSPAAGRAAPMSLEELERELVAGFEDDAEDEDDIDEPYEAFSALTNFKFDRSAIMQPFVDAR